MPSYGSGRIMEVRCERCQSWATGHEISKMENSNALREKVNQVKVAAQSRSEEGFMAGGLIAKTDTGEDIKILAISSTTLNDKIKLGAGDWELASVDVPDADGLWNDIYGRTFRMPSGLEFPVVRGKSTVSKKCAAMRLLLQLGVTFREHHKKAKGYRSIQLYEEGHDVGTVYRTDTLNDFGDVSCRACEIRIPVLLCNGVE